MIMRRPAPALRVVDEVAGARGLQQVGGQRRGLAEVVGLGQRLLDQVARMAAAERDLARAVIARAAGPRRALVVGDVAFRQQFSKICLKSAIVGLSANTL